MHDLGWKAYHRAYYEANKEVLKDKYRQYYEANKDKYRQYYEANKDKYLTYASRGLTRAERVAEIQRKYSGEGGVV